VIVDSETNTKGLYSLLISAVVPRPIAWVSTCSEDGKSNLAPFSFFNLFAIDPPVLGFSPGLKRKEGRSQLVFKDTLRNVIAVEEFVVNLVSAPLAAKMVQSSADYKSNTSEFDAVGLSPAVSCKIRPPRLAEAPVSLECKLHQIVELGTSHLILGRIVCVHVDDAILDGPLIDVEKFQPVARLGGELYATLAKPFAIARPTV
jgi:flavin reductase (DIM6/NTAB) family NADH-FMN oxidoreductase RutF